ncbi:MAG: NUDIX hydrolase [Bacteroidales bacterium]|nr:NUDIX hydrolase [Bacteroidales bacterium]
MPYTYAYPRPAVTADILVFADDGRSLLLIQRGNDPYQGLWAFPGGFFDMSDTDIEHTAARELEEETGLANIPLALVAVASREGRDPRGRTVTVAFMADVNRQSVELRAGDDAKLAQWFPLDELPPLAFDHSEILEKALRARHGEKPGSHEGTPANPT